MTLTVHAPLAFDPLEDPDDPRMASTIEFAQDIGAVLLNLHLDTRQGVEAFGDALQPTLRATRKAQLALALENTVWTGPADCNEFFHHLGSHHRAQSGHVGLCFDLGHANVCAATRNDYLGFLDGLSPSVPLVHTHLHENYGDRDSHLPLFTGPSRENPAGVLGLLERLRARAFDGCAILEQWPQPPHLLVEARDRLKVLINTVG
jgi:sugar phosphate isomerase/epimerase